MKLVKLFEDWEDEDDKSKRDKSDRDRVACNSEDWEQDPVFDKMRDLDPNLSQDDLQSAFQKCCKKIKAPHMRDEFEACMMEELELQK